jgi:hypothetical protein
MERQPLARDLSTVLHSVSQIRALLEVRRQAKDATAFLFFSTAMFSLRAGGAIHHKQLPFSGRSFPTEIDTHSSLCQFIPFLSFSASQVTARRQLLRTKEVLLSTA